MENSCDGGNNDVNCDKACYDSGSDDNCDGHLDLASAQVASLAAIEQFDNT